MHPCCAAHAEHDVNHAVQHRNAAGVANLMAPSASGNALLQLNITNPFSHPLEHQATEMQIEPACSSHVHTGQLPPNKGRYQPACNPARLRSTCITHPAAHTSETTAAAFQNAQRRINMRI